MSSSSGAATFFPSFLASSTLKSGSVGSFRLALALNEVPQGVTIVSGSSPPEGGGDDPPPLDGAGLGEGAGDGEGDPPPPLPPFSPSLPQEDGGILFMASLYDLA